MTGYVALLRGVNVGGSTTIAMADLRASLTDLGLGEVRTFLRSGNAVFTSDATAGELEPLIEKALAGELGLTTRVLVRSAAEVDAVIAAHPLVDVADSGSRMLAVFLSDEPDPALVAAHDVTARAPAEIRVGTRVVYQWCPDGVTAAPALVPFVEKFWQVAATARNWNTVGKLSSALAG